MQRKNTVKQNYEKLT